MEVWKAVDGFEGRYEISNYGRVKSLARGHPTISHFKYEERVMIIQQNNNSYRCIKLRKPGVHQKFLIHRLVALAFLEWYDDGKDYVNHKDKDRGNNHVDNLEFMTHQENMDHRDNYDPDEPF